MSLAAETREAVRNRPVLFEALRTGVVNYTAAADSLNVEGDREAIATALRRFAADLDDSPAREKRSITVRLHSAIEAVDSAALLTVDGAGLVVSGGASDDSRDIDLDSQTAVRVTGDVDAQLLSVVLARLQIEEIPVAAAGSASEAMVVVVPRRQGPSAVQLIEAVAASSCSS